MDIVKFTEAVILNKIGYNYEYNNLYNARGDLIDKSSTAEPDCVPAPRLDDAIYWLMDNCDVKIELSTIYHEEYKKIITSVLMCTSEYDDTIGDTGDSKSVCYADYNRNKVYSKCITWLVNKIIEEKIKKIK